MSRSGFVSHKIQYIYHYIENIDIFIHDEDFFTAQVQCILCRLFYSRFIFSGRKINMKSGTITLGGLDRQQSIMIVDDRVGSRQPRATL
jgi:hypothetical protein